MKSSLPQHWVCFHCRKQFRKEPDLNKDEGLFDGKSDRKGCLCPECKHPMINMGKYFQVPRRRDRKAWKQLHQWAEHGVRFHMEGTAYRMRHILSVPNLSQRHTKLLIEECPCHHQTEGQCLLLSFDRKRPHT